MGRPSTYWKDGEQRVARLFDGKRIPCSGSAADMKGDVLHDNFFIEVKNRGQGQISVVGWYNIAREQCANQKKEKDRKKKVLLIVHEKRLKRDLVVLDIKDFIELLGGTVVGEPTEKDKDVYDKALYAATGTLPGTQEPPKGITEEEAAEGLSKLFGDEEAEEQAERAAMARRIMGTRE